MDTYNFHINLYDVAFLGAIFTGLIFALQLWFAKHTNRFAKRFLGLAMLVMVLWMMKILGVDIRIVKYFPHWGWLPLQFSLAFGPLIYLYVRKITRPEYKLRWKGLLHFIPLLLEQVIWLAEIRETVKTGAAIDHTHVFQQLNPILQLLTFVSILMYLYQCHRMIQGFHKRVKANVPDATLYDLRWLHRLLVAFGLVWLLWVPYAVVDSYHHYLLGITAYYPLYLLLAIMAIWIAAEVFSRPGFEVPALVSPAPKSHVPAELMQKAVWLRKTMEASQFYRDAELTVGSLAEKLEIQPYELSRVVNLVFGKNFSDFVNEYRIRDVIREMQDPAYDHITLLGVAFDCGFNSKTTFNRTFKEITGKSPAEYKNDLKKQRPFSKMERRARIAALISTHETIPVWSTEKLKRNYMIRNYFKVAWRYMLHNKVYSVLNIVGLATGMAVALLIGLWIYTQYSYDRFLPGYDQLYQVELNFYHSDQILTQPGSPLPLIDELKRNYPEVKYAAELDWGGQHSLVVGDKKLDPLGFSVGKDFLRMFTYPLLEGNINSVFADPNSIVLTESVAKALFGDQDPMNKMIRIDNQYNIKVTGVIKDLPVNASLQFSYLLPYSLIEATNPSAIRERTNWNGYSNPEVLELQPGANAEAFESKIKNIINKHEKEKKIEIMLQPAKNWILRNQFKDGKAVDSYMTYVRMFGVIGILVLVIACINFVNLSTARAEKRAREVGVRKSVGSLRRDLVFQFLSESLLVTLMAFALSILIVQLVLPSFNTLTAGFAAIPYTSGIFWCVMLGYVLVTGLLAGSRPAFYLSSFKPVKVLKGTVQLGKRASLPRKIMVAVQFSCSIALIISTLIIYQQLQYAKNRPKGYNVDRLMISNDSNDLQKSYVSFKHDLLESGQVESVTRSGSSMTNMPASFSILDFPGKKPGESLEMYTTPVSPDYFKTVGMTFVAGHDFTGGSVPDTLHIVINEAAAQRLRLKNPVDKVITIEYTKNPLRIIGVVKNAVIGSPFYAAIPALYVYNPGWGGTIMYRLNPNVGTQQALKKIGAIFDKYNPSYPFAFSFADAAFAQQYQLESLVGTLASIFAGLAIFISCLGLFGLSAYVAEQRKKEIGIRKVLGASVPQVWALLSRDFLALVGISCVIASPIAFYFLYEWLQKYNYRITIGPWAFIIAATLTIVITILTISWQAISSALANPVNSLRSE